jgi:hypothetical protein
MVDPGESVGVFVAGNEDEPDRWGSVAKNLTFQTVPTGGPFSGLNALSCVVESSEDVPGKLRTGEMEITGAPRDGGSLNRHLNVGTSDDANKYYELIDPDGKRANLRDFLLENDFGTVVADQFRLGPEVVSAYYVNSADLGLGRSMHMRKRANGDIAYYVRNFLTVDEAIATRGEQDAQVAIATVAMEYSPIDPNDPACAPGCKRVTKFYIFDGDNVRTDSANLDGRDQNRIVRTVPGLCTVCHGGGGFSAANPDPNPDVDARFIPFDAEAFGFADQNGFRRDDQEKALKQMNVAILTHTDAMPGVKEVVCGWYWPDSSAPASCDPTLLTRNKQRSSFLPAGWRARADRDLYRHVVARSCRTCHLQRDPSLDFETADEFRGHKESIEAVACRERGNGSAVLLQAPDMPHSRWAFLNFWLNPSPRLNEDTGRVELWHQPAVLEESLQLGSQCTPSAKVVGLQGDVNKDGKLDDKDKQLLTTVVEDYARTFKSRAVYTYPNPFDRNNDGMITSADAQ